MYQLVHSFGERSNNKKYGKIGTEIEDTTLVELLNLVMFDHED